MSYSSNLTRERILECAKQEFMDYGYQNANMRRIARTAKATTGALYNHFANKEVLFDALVQAPAEEMLAQFQEIHRQTEKSLSIMPAANMEEKARTGTDWMLEYIYEHMDAFRLVFCHSEGTRWSTYLEQLIEIEEQAYRVYCDTLGKNGRHVEDMFLHVTAATGFQYLVELVSHNLPYDQAVAVMDSVKRFSIAGWHEILGLRP
ncbi:TetR/AcrR family transcriptional regulator [Faecalicatena contorta]|uniref:Regulatory protein, tetR family n=1 Tax=Faecalicatena contorta TaxID=39482 RepID=A0A316A5T0_9FIRM|nr:TetR/AcrR family transcriptional regulator [Faecalicatena contorta]PWJ52310.1 TetR family transcriptional regulator [Faecalicatena contorta]SUQ12588.1 regulatory protein, tetR family [Faecalicatena contorta]